MRTHVWAATAALVVALGIALRAPTAPIIAAGNTSTLVSAQPSFFTKLTTTMLVTPTTQLASFFAPTPSIASPLGVVTMPPVPMTNGVPNAAYFKMFNLQVAPRSPK
jgi:hypothetical protein